MISGKKKGGDGNIEDVPSGFLKRSDFKICLWEKGDSFVSLSEVKALMGSSVAIAGWHELRVKKSDVERLWPNRTASGREYTAKIREVAEWFCGIEEVKKNGEQAGTKDAHYRVLYHSQFHDQKYSDRMFNCIWKKHAPSHWRKSNAEKKSGKIKAIITLT